jgi:hypothetical protein
VGFAAGSDVFAGTAVADAAVVGAGAEGVAAPPQPTNQPTVAMAAINVKRIRADFSSLAARTA